MTQNVDDVQSYDSGFIKAIERLESAPTSQKNKDTIKSFVVNCRTEKLAKSTITNYLNLLTRMTSRLEENGFNKNLDELEQTDFDKLLLFLEDE